MLKNCILLLHCLVCFALLADAQQKFPSIDSLQSFVVHPSSQPIAVDNLPFQNIVLVDRRFDTSKIGYVKTGRSYKKIITEGNFAVTLQDFLNKKYVSTTKLSPLTLVIVLKKCWLEETVPAQQKNYKITNASDAAEQATCHAGFDVYIQLDKSYIPVFKWDTTCTQKRMLKKCADELITQPFDFCIAKIRRMDFSKIGQAKVKLEWAAVEQYNMQRLDFPRFKNEITERGIYKTFDDFLRNKPTAREFKIEFGKQTDEVFIVENGKPELLANFWGVCDGEKNYIKIGFNLFELVKQDNTYDLWGSKIAVNAYAQYTPNGVNASPESIVIAALGGLLNSNDVVNFYKPLQLNMETGEVY